MLWDAEHSFPGVTPREHSQGNIASGALLAEMLEHFGLYFAPEELGGCLSPEQARPAVGKNSRRMDVRENMRIR